MRREILKVKLRIEKMKEYLQLKIEEEDWHAVSDAANDIRDMESYIQGLEYK